jgi:hypothetical protein
MESTMRTNEDREASSPIQGQFLRRSERREVAIFLRDRALWVADFIDGQGELIDAPTWFRFNCGELSNSHARRRMVRESAIPLSEELVARIERLPLPACGPKRGAMGRLVKTIMACLPRIPFAPIVAARLRRRQAYPVDSADRDAGISNHCRAGRTGESP